MAVSKGEATREMIVERAFDLFVAKGYHATSMRELAEAAGLAPASVYNHFPNKEAIFQEVLQRFHPYREIIAAMQAAQGETVEEVVGAAAQRAMEIVAARDKLVNLMFIEIVEFGGLHARDIFQKAFPPALAQFSHKLRAARGELRPLPEPDRLLALIGVFVSQWLMHLQFAPQEDPARQQARLESAVQVYLHGILVSPSTEEST